MHARLSITFRRDGRTLVVHLRCNDHRKDKLRRIWHGVRSSMPSASSALKTYIHTQLPFERSLNVHSVHGPVVNPYQHLSSTLDWHARERRSAGGSSGGSGAAVAAGMCDA